MPHLPSLLPAVAALTGQQLQPHHFAPLGGGSINQVYCAVGNLQRPFVLKVNCATNFPQLFEREAQGLAQLQPYISVPEVIGYGQEEKTQFLVLEWIKEESPTPLFWKRFGEALARLHSVQGPEFGNSMNNYMGAVPQDNTPEKAWSLFFATRRILPLARMCAEKGLLGKSEMGQIEKIGTKLPALFSDAPPTLLHGDLWSGNFLCGAGARPVLIDPAVYYGHPSMDLAMTTLFGGFPPLFYEAYQYHRPLPPGHKAEWELCNLYPLLIHLFLFGAGYLNAVKRTLDRFAGTPHRIV